MNLLIRLKFFLGDLKSDWVDYWSQFHLNRLRKKVLGKNVKDEYVVKTLRNSVKHPERTLILNSDDQRADDSQYDRLNVIIDDNNLITNLYYDF